MAQYRSPYSNFYSEKTGSYMNIGSIVPVLVDSYSTNIDYSGEGSKLNDPNDPDSDVIFPPHYAYKGFLYCDGSSYDIKKFPQLFQTIRGNYTTDFENIDSINFSESGEPGSLYRVFIHGGDLYAEFYSEDNDKFESDGTAIYDRLIPNGAKLTFKDIKDFPMGGGSRTSTSVNILDENGNPIDEETDNPFLNDVTTIPVVSTAGIAEGMKVKGSNLRSGITVSSVIDGNTLVLSNEVNLTNGEELTFINPGVIEEGVAYPLEYLDLYQEISDYNQGVANAPQNTHVYRILFTDEIAENNPAIDNPTTESGFVSWPVKILGGDFEKVFNEYTSDPNKPQYPFLARRFYGTVPEYHYGSQIATGRTFYPGAKNIIPPFSWNYLNNELPQDGTEVVSYEILLENTAVARENAVHWHIRNLPPTFTAFPSNLSQEDFDELIAQGAIVENNTATDDFGYDPKFVNYGYTGPQPENEADEEQTNEIYRFYVVAILNRKVPDNTPTVSTSVNGVVEETTTVVLDTTAGILAGMEVTGGNLESGVTVSSVTDGVTLELSEASTLANDAILTFANPAVAQKLVTYFDFAAGTRSGNPIRDARNRTHEANGGIPGELGPFFELNSYVEGESSGTADTGDEESLVDVKISDLTEQPVIKIQKSFSMRDFPLILGKFNVPDYRDRKLIGFGDGIEGSGTPIVEDRTTINVGDVGGRWYISTDTIVDPTEFYSIGDVITTGYENVTAPIQLYLTGEKKYTVGPVQGHTFNRPSEHDHRLLHSQVDQRSEHNVGGLDTYTTSWVNYRGSVDDFFPTSTQEPLDHSHGLVGSRLKSNQIATFGNTNGIGESQPADGLSSLEYDVYDELSGVINLQPSDHAYQQYATNATGNSGGFGKAGSGTSYLPFGPTTATATVELNAGGYAKAYVIGIAGTNTNGGSMPEQASENLTVVLQDKNGSASSPIEVIPAQGSTSSAAYKITHQYWKKYEIEIPEAFRSPDVQPLDFIFNQSVSGTYAGNNFGIAKIGLSDGVMYDENGQPQNSNCVNYFVTSSEVHEYVLAEVDGSGTLTFTFEAGEIPFEIGDVVEITKVTDTANSSAMVGSYEITDVLSNGQAISTGNTEVSGLSDEGGSVRLANGFYRDGVSLPNQIVHVFDTSTKIEGKPNYVDSFPDADIFFQKSKNTTGPFQTTESDNPNTNQDPLYRYVVEITGAGGGGGGSTGKGGDGGDTTISFSIGGKSYTFTAGGGKGGKAGNSTKTGGDGGSFTVASGFETNTSIFAGKVENSLNGTKGTNGLASPTAASSGGGGGSKGGNGGYTTVNKTGSTDSSVINSSGSFNPGNLISSITGATATGLTVTLSGGAGGDGNGINKGFGNSGCHKNAAYTGAGATYPSASYVNYGPNAKPGGEGGAGRAYKIELPFYPGNYTVYLGEKGNDGDNSTDGKNRDSGQPGGDGYSSGDGGSSGNGAWGNGASGGGGGGASALIDPTGIILLGVGGGGGGGGSGGGYNGGRAWDWCYRGEGGRGPSSAIIPTSASMTFGRGTDGTQPGCTGGGGGGGGGGAGVNGRGEGGKGGTAGVGHGGYDPNHAASNLTNTGGGGAGRAGQSCYRTKAPTISGVDESVSTPTNQGGSTGNGYAFYTVNWKQDITNPSGGGGGGGGKIKFTITVAGNNLSNDIRTSFIASVGKGGTAGAGGGKKGDDGSVTVTALTATTEQEQTSIDKAENTRLTLANYPDGAYNLTSGDPSIIESTFLQGGSGILKKSSEGVNVVAYDTDLFPEPSLPEFGTYGRYVRFAGSETKRFLTMGPFNLEDVNTLVFAVARGGNNPSDSGNDEDPPEEPLALYWKKEIDGNGQTLGVIHPPNDGDFIGWGKVKITLDPDNIVRRSGNIYLELIQERPSNTGGTDNKEANTDIYGLGSVGLVKDEVPTKTFVPTMQSVLPGNLGSCGDDSGIDTVTRTVTAKDTNITVNDGVFRLTAATPISVTASSNTIQPIPLITKYHRSKYLIKAF